MSFRESFGFALIAIAAVLFPVGQVFSRYLWALSLVLMIAGVCFFYTDRMIRREERQAKESSRSSGAGSGMPTDIHNYSGWRTGGRTESFDSESAGAGEASD